MLTNGRYHLMITREGTGFSRWDKLALTRWSDDAVGGGLGSFCYIRDESSGVVWSTTPQPVNKGEDVVQANFSVGRASFIRRHSNGSLDVTARTDIVVDPENDLELRRVNVHNLSGELRTLSVTSYLEVVLGNATADAAHPAFEKLFVESELLPEWQAIL
ncbi:hypothetical protein, partial [Acidovorax sp. A1169]|uniref:hypothetical protein n=1 Tax=Acidovorax sp. A1169 TaxID=3059524 RepID=UPI002737CE29